MQRALSQNVRVTVQDTGTIEVLLPDSDLTQKLQVAGGGERRRRRRAAAAPATEAGAMEESMRYETFIISARDSRHK